MHDEPYDQEPSDLPSDLAQPARRALRQAGYTRLEHLADPGESEIKHLHGIGPKAIDHLRRALSVRGLSFADGAS